MYIAKHNVSGSAFRIVYVLGLLVLDYSYASVTQRYVVISVRYHGISCCIHAYEAQRSEQLFGPFFLLGRILYYTFRWLYKR